MARQREAAVAESYPVRSYGTWEEAVAEANRMARVYAAKFGGRHQYVVRKRRTVWPSESRRVWNMGRHDLWHVLTGPNVPDRRTQ